MASGGRGKGIRQLRRARGRPSRESSNDAKITRRFGGIDEDFPAYVGVRNTRGEARAIERGERGRAKRIGGRSSRAAAERGEGDRGRTHVDAKHAVSGDVELGPFLGAHEAHHLLLIGEVDVGVLVAAADLFETDHRARKRVVSPKRSSVEAKGVSVTPAVALRCDLPCGFDGKITVFGKATGPRFFNGL